MTDLFQIGFYNGELKDFVMPESNRLRCTWYETYYDGNGLEHTERKEWDSESQEPCPIFFIQYLIDEYQKRRTNESNIS